MGTAFFPVFEDAESYFPDDINGKCLARAANLLDKHCKAQAVPTLCDFFSVSRDTMIIEVLDGDPDDPTSYDASQLPEEHWFGTEAGLRTVRLLIDYVRENNSRFTEFDWIGLPDCVLGDLKAFEKHLTAAAKRGTRWHLVIDC